MFQSLHCNKLLYSTAISIDIVRLETGWGNRWYSEVPVGGKWWGYILL